MTVGNRIPGLQARVWKLNSWGNKMGTFLDFLKPSTSKYKYTELEMSSGKVSIKTEGILKTHMRTVSKTP